MRFKNISIFMMKTKKF